MLLQHTPATADRNILINVANGYGWEQQIETTL